MKKSLSLLAVIALLMTMLTTVSFLAQGEPENAQPYVELRAQFHKQAENKAKFAILYLGGPETPVTLATGDTLSYDVWLDTNTVGIGALEIKTTTGFGHVSGDNLTASDGLENGLRLDLTDKAYRKWHSRVLTVNAPMDGQQIDTLALAVQILSDCADGPYMAARYRNIRLCDKGGNLKYTFDCSQYYYNADNRYGAFVEGGCLERQSIVTYGADGARVPRPEGEPVEVPLPQNPADQADYLQVDFRTADSEVAYISLPVPDTVNVTFKDTIEYEVYFESETPMTGGIDMFNQAFDNGHGSHIVVTDYDSVCKIGGERVTDAAPYVGRWTTNRVLVNDGHVWAGATKVDYVRIGGVSEPDKTVSLRLRNIVLRDEKGNVKYAFYTGGYYASRYDADNPGENLHVADRAPEHIAAYTITAHRADGKPLRDPDAVAGMAPTEVTAAYGEPVIDGDLDETFWKKGVTVDEDSARASLGAVTGPLDVSFGWNAQGLLIGARITDGSVCDTDALRIGLNPASLLSDEEGLQFSIGLKDGEVWITRDTHEPADISEQATAAGKITANGWQAEISIPWEAVNVLDTAFTPDETLELKATAGYTDVDGEETNAFQVVLTDAANDDFTTASYPLTLKLQPKPGEPDPDAYLEFRAQFVDDPELALQFPAKYALILLERPAETITLATGDYLSYDVWLDTYTAGIGRLDIKTTTGWGHSSDENASFEDGLFPLGADLTASAYLKWYTRKMTVNAPMNGQTLDTLAVAVQIPADTEAGPYLAARYRHIALYDKDGQVKYRFDCDRYYYDAANKHGGFVEQGSKVPCLSAQVLSTYRSDGVRVANPAGTTEAVTLLSSEARLANVKIGDVNGSVSGDTFILRLPKGTDVTALTPELTITNGATVDKTGPQDFTSPVTYTVTAEDGVHTAAYTVKVVLVEGGSSGEGDPYLEFRALFVEDPGLALAIPAKYGIINLKTETGVTLAAGDYLSYDVWLGTYAPGIGAVEVITSNGYAHTSGGLGEDQNGIANGFQLDLTEHAYMNWYTRKLTFSEDVYKNNAALLNLALTVQIDATREDAAYLEARYRNIRICDKDGKVKYQFDCSRYYYDATRMYGSFVEQGSGVPCLADQAICTYNGDGTRIENPDGATMEVTLLSREARLAGVSINGVEGFFIGKHYTVYLPAGTDVTALEPDLLLSRGATADKTGPQDFTAPVEYVVTAEDGVTKDTFDVTVKLDLPDDNDDDDGEGDDDSSDGSGGQEIPSTDPSEGEDIPATGRSLVLAVPTFLGIAGAVAATLSRKKRNRG